MKLLELNHFRDKFQSDDHYGSFITSVKEAIDRAGMIMVTDGGKLVCVALSNQEMQEGLLDAVAKLRDKK